MTGDNGFSSEDESWERLSTDSYELYITKWNMDRIPYALNGNLSKNRVLAHNNSQLYTSGFDCWDFQIL